MSAEFGIIVGSRDSGTANTTYILFDNSPLIPNGVTFGGVLNGEVDDHNNQHDFSVNHVRVADIRGNVVDGQVTRRAVVFGDSVEIKHGEALRVLTGNKEAVSAVIGAARRRAATLQTPSTATILPASPGNR